jgi:hypothetical protein
VAVARTAAQPDVGPEAIDKPLRATTGVCSPQAQDIAEAELDDCGPIGAHYGSSGGGRRIM